MSIAILLTKPAQATWVLPAFRARYPQETLDFPLTLLRGFYHLPLPRGKSWASYPLLVPMDDRMAYQPLALPGVWGAPVLIRSVPGAPLIRVEGAEAYEAALTRAQRMYSAVDPSPSDSWAAEFLRQRFGSPDQQFRALLLHDLSAGSIERSLEATQTDPNRGLAGFHAQARRGQVKAYFDHQFLVNSLAILGKTVGRPDEGVPWVSKYQLQTLYALAAWPPLREADIFHRMRYWIGSGKYSTEGSDGLGSAASRWQILKQLHMHGWLEALPASTAAPVNRLFQISDTGRAMLRRLHPDCEDPDLPFRLESWMEAGLAVSQPRMDRYLRTFFGKQKRFLDHPSP